MKEKPILFSSEMVRAILEGRKTQTRRVIKHGKHFVTQCKTYQHHPGGGWWGTDGVLDAPGCDIGFTCPYGEPGDRLWVRETWATVDTYDPFSPSEIPCGSKRWPIVWYAADPGAGGLHQTTCQWVGKVRPSIFMPRWASRITLEVVNVRVERVQEISEDDAFAEGIEVPRTGPTEFGEPAEAVYQYMRLWDSINAKRGYPWSSNPWVWVVEWPRLKKDNDFPGAN